MKKFVVAMLCVCLVALAIPAMAGSLTVLQSQTQGVIQGQASVGGFSASTQGYVTAANQAYQINKLAVPILSPSTGAAAASTGSATGANQVKFGNGFQAQGMLGGTTNNGALIW
jgi:hypothetical protein